MKRPEPWLSVDPLSRSSSLLARRADISPSTLKPLLASCEVNDATPEQPFEILPGVDAAKRYTFEEKRMYLESGVLGRIFGSNQAAPMNISGFVVGLLVVAGVILILARGVAESVQYFKIVVPLITLALGYLFGKRPDAA